MDVALEVVAKAQHVVFELGGPVVAQSIFGAEAKHPSAGGPVGRHPGSQTGKAGGGIGADVGPGAAQFAVDEPTIVGPADPRRESGHPVSPRLGGPLPKPPPWNKKVWEYEILDARPEKFPFTPKHPLVALIIKPALPAADKAAIAIVAASHTESDMTADVKA